MDCTGSDLTLWRFSHGRVETIHVIASIAVIAKQKLVLEETHRTSPSVFHTTMNIWMEADSRRSRRCRTCCSTCTRCTASGTSSQQPSSREWTAGRRGDLRVKIMLIIHIAFAAQNDTFLTLLQRRTRAPAVWAGHQLLGLAGLEIGFGVSQAEVTIFIRQCDAIWAFLGCWETRLIKKKK